PSGENLAFDAEVALLRAYQSDESIYCRRSDDLRREGKIGTMNGALSIPWNPFSAHTIEKRISEAKPDVIHAHNIFPLISPSIFHKTGRQAARIVTLHNYRLFCPSATLNRNNNVCTSCLDSRSNLPALVYGCY